MGFASLSNADELTWRMSANNTGGFTTQCTSDIKDNKLAESCDYTDNKAFRNLGQILDGVLTLPTGGGNFTIPTDFSGSIITGDNGSALTIDGSGDVTVTGGAGHDTVVLNTAPDDVYLNVDENGNFIVSQNSTGGETGLSGVEEITLNDGTLVDLASTTNMESSPGIYQSNSSYSYIVSPRLANGRWDTTAGTSGLTTVLEPNKASYTFLFDMHYHPEKYTQTTNGNFGFITNTVTGEVDTYIRSSDSSNIRYYDRGWKKLWN